MEAHEGGEIAGDKATAKAAVDFAADRFPIVDACARRLKFCFPSRFHSAPHFSFTPETLLPFSSFSWIFSALVTLAVSTCVSVYSSPLSALLIRGFLQNSRKLFIPTLNPMLFNCIDKSVHHDNRD